MPIENFSQATDVGLMRENNEDAICSSPSLGLWLVADGMGGHAAGEVASKIVSEVIVKSVASGEALADAVQLAHRSILQAVGTGEGKYGMGSTVVALKSHSTHYQIAWVGDSRAYLCSGAQKDLGALKPLSIDHSYVQMLYQSGMITAEEMSSHPEKNIITQCLGSNEAEQVHVDVTEGIWQPNDLILLCSDGLSDVVSEQAMAVILSGELALELKCKALIEAALAGGGRDNISVILVSAPTEVSASTPISWVHGLFSKIMTLFRG